jgi:hypothetical protein
MTNAGTDPDLMTLQQYVSDMLALETHIEESLDGQRAAVREHPAASLAVQRFETMVRTQREAMRSHLRSIGGNQDNANNNSLFGQSQELVKNAVTTAFGMAAGAINNLRPHPVSKALRDDYTAFNHAIVGYGMLITTAALLEHQPTVEIAERHLQAYEGAIEEITGLIPEVVAWELRKDGRIFDDRLVGTAAQILSRAWRSTEDSQRQAA